MQEIGRAGRDGEPSTIVLHYNAADIASNVIGMQQEMIDYCRTYECKREFLSLYFMYKKNPIRVLHDCCSSCACKCECDTCLMETVM